MISAARIFQPINVTTGAFLRCRLTVIKPSASNSRNARYFVYLVTPCSRSFETGNVVLLVFQDKYSSSIQIKALPVFVAFAAFTAQDSGTFTNGSVRGRRVMAESRLSTAMRRSCLIT
jgi:hypothetical protein